jgi:hypothetical protein
MWLAAALRASHPKTQCEPSGDAAEDAAETISRHRRTPTPSPPFQPYNSMRPRAQDRSKRAVLLQLEQQLCNLRVQEAEEQCIATESQVRWHAAVGWWYRTVKRAPRTVQARAAARAGQVAGCGVSVAHRRQCSAPASACGPCRLHASLPAVRCAADMCTPPSTRRRRALPALPRAPAGAPALLPLRSCCPA